MSQRPEPDEHQVADMHIRSGIRDGTMMTYKSCLAMLDACRGDSVIAETVLALYRNWLIRMVVESECNHG